MKTRIRAQQYIADDIEELACPKGHVDTLRRQRGGSGSASDDDSLHVAELLAIKMQPPDNQTTDFSCQPPRPLHTSSTCSRSNIPDLQVQDPNPSSPSHPAYFSHHNTVHRAGIETQREQISSEAFSYSAFHHPRRCKPSNHPRTSTYKRITREFCACIESGL
jgi:hypothetical protein